MYILLYVYTFFFLRSECVHSQSLGDVDDGPRVLENWRTREYIKNGQSRTNVSDGTRIPPSLSEITIHYYCYKIEITYTRIRTDRRVKRVHNII